jgi:hypothetical protein
MTMMTIQSQVGTVILSSGTRRFYGERTGTCNVRPTRLPNGYRVEQSATRALDPQQRH